METLSNTNRTSGSNSLRMGLTLAGIVTAVLCSLALLQDASSGDRATTSLPRLVDHVQIVPASVNC